MCSSWGHELGPVPGTKRNFIFDLSAHCMLISTEETSFSFLPPKRRSQSWLTSLDRVTLPSWPLSRPASCPSLSWRNSFDKVLGPVWKSPSPLLSQTKLIWNGWVNLTFSLWGTCVHMRGEGLLETVSRLSTWNPYTSPTLPICSAFRGMRLGCRGSGDQFSEEWLKYLGPLNLEKRKLREILRIVSMSLLKVYFGIISQRKIGTNVEKLQRGKLP